MIGFDPHDHRACIDAALRTVEDRCRAEGLQLTPVRRRVLEILLARHRALGAYEILDHLGKEGFGTQPPVAYRALDFLIHHGFAHKIERLNAFVACSRLGAAHAPAFLICRLCGRVAEATAAPDRGALAQAASATRFEIERVVVEAFGVCPACAAGAP